MISFVRFFNVMPTIKKKKIVRILNAKISNLKIKVKFTILNKFAIILQLN